MFSSRCTEGFTEADRQFIRRTRRWLSVTLIAYFVLNFALTRHLRGTPGALLAGLTGSVFFVLMFLFGLLVARSGDEFRRALLLKSLVWATLVTMFGACVLGWMEVFSDVHVRVPVLAIPAFLVVATAAAKVLIFRRHRVMNEEPAA